jgi:transcriptional regulator with XRE-family HTH domain
VKSRTISERIGDALRRRREARDVSQEAFADEIGMHRTYYSALERGENNLTIKTLARVCSGLSVRVWEVMKDAEGVSLPSTAEPAPRTYDRKRKATAKKSQAAATKLTE